MVLQGNVTKASWRNSLHRWESTISHGSRRPQTKTAGAHQWEKPVVSLRQKSMKPQRKEAGGRKSEQPPNHHQPQPLTVDIKCTRVCTLRIRLYSHQQACKDRTSTSSETLVCEQSAHQTNTNTYCICWTASISSQMSYLRVENRFCQQCRKIAQVFILHKLCSKFVCQILPKWQKKERNRAVT